MRWIGMVGGRIFFLEGCEGRGKGSWRGGKVKCGVNGKLTVIFENYEAF